MSPPFPKTKTVQFAERLLRKLYRKIVITRFAKQLAAIFMATTVSSGVLRQLATCCARSVARTWLSLVSRHLIRTVPEGLFCGPVCSLECDSRLLDHVRYVAVKSPFLHDHRQIQHHSCATCECTIHSCEFHLGTLRNKFVNMEAFRG